MATRSGRLRRSDRLLRSRDFQRVGRAGRRRASRYFVVLMAPRSGERADERISPRDVSPGARLGITVSRKVGKSVARNRIKRAVREWFRTSREQLAEGVDLVVIARRDAALLDSRSIFEQLAELMSERAPRRTGDG